MSDEKKRAAMSKNLAKPADELARKVAALIEREKPPAQIKVGGGARLVPALALLPKKLLARVLGKKFGLL